MRRYKLFRDPLLLIALALMVASLAYIVYSFLPHVSSTNPSNILEEYVKAIQSLNKSSTALEKRVAGFYTVAPNISDVAIARDRIRGYLRNLSMMYGFNNSNFLVNTAKNYLYIAEAATNTTKGYLYINNSIDILRESLELLSICRVRDALTRYNRIEDYVLSSLSSIAKAVSMLNKVNKSCVAENHVPVIEASLERLEKVYTSIKSADDLMRIAKRYEDYIEALCSNQTINDAAALNSIQNELNQITVSGPLSPEVSNAQNTLIALIQSYLYGQSMNQQNQSGNYVGGGAGYVPPESSD
ncbi:MAG: hypothetical protein QXM62_05415 [Ignisphaera sp.]